MNKPRRPSRGGWLPAVLLLLAAAFMALGLWQIERRAWKHALIAAVDQRSTAAPIPPPGPGQWADLRNDAYRHVRAKGRYLAGHDTLVKAVTEHGPGFWVMTPLDTGPMILLVNRGFVPGSGYAPAPSGVVTVVGLLRLNEPGGGFLRHNDPSGERWYSRDVPLIAAARGLEHAAPYFIDADSAMNGPNQPIGGLTVIRFRDDHLIYALTWFALAGLSLWAMVPVMRARKERDIAGR